MINPLAIALDGIFVGYSPMTIAIMGWGSFSIEIILGQLPDTPWVEEKKDKCKDKYKKKRPLIFKIIYNNRFYLKTLYISPGTANIIANIMKSKVQTKNIQVSARMIK